MNDREKQPYNNKEVKLTKNYDKDIAAASIDDEDKDSAKHWLPWPENHDDNNKENDKKKELRK